MIIPQSCTGGAVQRLFLPEVPELGQALLLVLHTYKFLQVLGMAPDINITGIIAIVNEGLASSSSGSTPTIRLDIDPTEKIQTALQDPANFAFVQDSLIQSFPQYASALTNYGQSTIPQTIRYVSPSMIGQGGFQNFYRSAYLPKRSAGVAQSSYAIGTAGVAQPSYAMGTYVVR